MNPSEPVTLSVVNHAKGGIGNQLFQHVFAKSVAKKLGANLKTDTTFYGADPYGFHAQIWNLDPGAEAVQISSLSGSGAYLLKDSQIRALQELQTVPPDCQNLILSGYWQSEAYIDRAVAEETYQQLSAKAAAAVPADILKQIQASPNAVAVHLRRRDYAHMGICKPSYYVAAIEHIRKNFPDAEIFLFSDEPNYARHLLSSHGMTFTLVATGSDLQDLYLMSLCKHFVIANSSYSWWAAYFGESRGGLIFCPKEWVTIDATPSPCPPRWIQVADAVQPFAVAPDEVQRHGAALQKQRFDAAIRHWFAGQGDKTLRVNFDHLKPESVVFDLGGYKGDWTAEISSRYDAKVFVFEPIKSFHDQICTRFAGNPKVKAFQFGLGARDESMDLHLSADGTGVFGKGAAVEKVHLREVQSFLKQEGVEHIDLMKINIEGGEYDLLTRLIESGDIGKIDKLQIQFHDFVPNAIESRAKIIEGLKKTHRQSWEYYFVWEEWVRL